MTDIFYTQEYNGRDFDPPMPVLQIGLSKPGIERAKQTIEVIVDTGADGTLLPIDVLASIGVRAIDRASLIGITGERQLVDIYVVTIHIGTCLIRGIKVAALPPETTGILGRDVINQLQIHLIGPAQMLELVK